MESTFKTITLNRKEAQCVASYLKVVPSKIKDCDREELLWEITKKCTKGVSKEGLIEIAETHQIKLTSDSIVTIRLNIEQYLADRGMALAPISLPSVKEIAKAKLKQAPSNKAKASLDDGKSTEIEVNLPKVQKLSTEESQKRALLLGFNDASTSNRPDCISYISKRGIQNLEVPELQALCEKAGLSNDIYETRKTELRYALLEEASKRGIAIIPSVNWEALEKEYEFAKQQRQKIQEEKVAFAAEKLRLKEEALLEKERAKRSAYLEKERLKAQKAAEREQARLTKKQQAQAKKTAKAMGKLVGGILGGMGNGIGSMFKESKSEKARRKWSKSWNTFNTK